MNWSNWRAIPWVDTRAAFVAATPRGGSLLDLGSSDGETLCHIWELRPDLRLFSVDIAARPPRMPPRTIFTQLDLETQSLPWATESFDAITCMHVVEHLQSMKNLWPEIGRVLKPGGRVYVETPSLASVETPSAPGSLKRKVTMNFYDDPTHLRPVAVSAVSQAARDVGLLTIRSGRSRNWLFAAAYLILSLLPPTRKKYVAKLHWLGWSVYLIAQKPVA